MDIYEQWTYDALGKAGFAVFTPVNDRGIDCIVIGKDFRGYPQRVQIKGSRTYGTEYAWYKFSEEKLRLSVEITDFWVFVRTKISAKGRFQPEFLVIPTGDLCKRLEAYAKPSPGFYFMSMKFDQQTNRVIDTRNGKDGLVSPIRADSISPGAPRDYSRYRGDWKEISVRIR